MARQSSGNKEVGKRPSLGSTEETFGGKPPKISVSGGEMCLFGHKIHDGVWPRNVTSTDQKTGFPEGYDKPTKGPRP